MRKVLISTILAASTLAIAAPAAAQIRVSVGTQYGNPYGYQYGNQYGNPYGSQYGSQYGYNNYGQTRSLMVRVNRIEQQINQLDRRNLLSHREADQLRHQANHLARQLRQASYNGLNGYERRSFEVQIARLEQNIRYQANDGNRYGYNQYSNGYNGYDRDRDGRDDRYEDDRGDDHD